KTPFAGHSVEEIHRAQQSKILPIEQLKAAHVPARLRLLLESMLALEPASRPGTHQLAARLQRCSLEARTARRTRVTLAAAALLILMQVASQIFPFFEISSWAVRLVVLLLILGFPIALVLAWAFELTPEGLKRAERADREPAKPSRNKAWRQTESVKVAAKSI